MQTTVGREGDSVGGDGIKEGNGKDVGEGGGGGRVGLSR